MLVLARRIKHPLDVTVQGSHDADPRKHRRAAKAVLLIVSFVWPSFVSGMPPSKRRPDRLANRPIDWA
jgi:hypothetical protein